MTPTADYDTKQVRLEQVGALYTVVTHYCCVCGAGFHSANKKDAKDTITAAKTNRDGPYCPLCLHLEMAARLAEARGYLPIRYAMNQWRKHHDPKTDPATGGCYTIS